MIVESAVLIVVLVSGAALVTAFGMRGWLSLPVGFLAGVALQQLVTAALLVTTGSARPLVVLAVMVASTLIWVGRVLARVVDLPRLRLVVTGVSVTLAVVALTHALTLVRYHVDSMVYLNLGVVLARDAWPVVASEYTILTRGIGLAAVHAPASLAGGTYLHAVTPLIAIAGLAVVAGVVRRDGHAVVGPRGATTVAALAALSLALTNRFVFHSFYLNGHLVTGTWLAVVVGLLWLRVNGKLAASQGVAVAVGLAAAGVVLTRPEGALLVALATLPFLLSGRLLRREAGVVAALPATAGVLWFLGAPLASGTTISSTLALQVAACTAPLLWWIVSGVRVLRVRASLALRVTEAAMWLALVGLVAWRPSLFFESAYATAANAVWGKWGVSLFVLWTAVLAAALWLRVRDDVLLRFPVTTFLPLVFVLVYLRDGTYRIGHFDSLNRMWLEWMLVATIFVAVGVARGDSAFARRVTDTISRVGRQ